MGNDETFAGNIERFSGFAAHYDGHRPSPPARLAALLKELAGIHDERARVIDLGCGTGLSTRYWIGKAERIVGIEPSDSMRSEAEMRGGDGVSYQRGFSHDTGLPDACADIVFCSQALHWMDPRGTFVEAARILRSGGVFAACDYDWPPVTGVWELDRAYLECDLKARGIEEQMGLKKVLNFHEKSGHLGRMEASGASAGYGKFSSIMTMKVMRRGSSACCRARAACRPCSRQE